MLAARMSGDHGLLPYAKSAVEVMLTQSMLLAHRQNVIGSRFWIAILENDRDDLREFYGTCCEIMSPQCEVGFHEPLGVAARMLGDLDASVQHLRAGMVKRVAFLPIHAWVCHELAETLFLRGKEGDREEAASLWKEALELAERIELEPLVRRVKARLAEAFPPALPDGLSPREAEVLRLVTRGSTNKEIAAELFISEKTVQNHLTSIFAKTGSGNRTEAAGYALKRGMG